MASKGRGWESIGFETLKRSLVYDTPVELLPQIPAALEILVPDIGCILGKGRGMPKKEDFLFFDLETTGLSGGAGTVAFLAAFGKFTHNNKIHITQYLLLDYPGENDFLQAALGEFDGNEKVIVSYNGKSFDSQILKTRCLMNGIRPPEYHHIDLLHPARRLWKGILENCSQGTIETGILGIDRTGDIPGAMAPEIWFDFLRTGDMDNLMGICEHNCRDITGLASILAAIVSIAAAPCAGKYNCHLERLALHWLGYNRLRKYEKADDAQTLSLLKTGNELLRLAAGKNYPRAAYYYALDKLHNGECEKGRKKLLGIAAGDFPPAVKAAAIRALAIDSERRLAQPLQALELARQGLALELTGSWRSEFEHRAQRLEKKLALNHSSP
ncbi:MAG: ribonuclease H-like domain-containing protein [Treponema sp.]|nr:ribonuclease H-like domain-containing protein [Treponema sp.]